MNERNPSADEIVLQRFGFVTVPKDGSQRFQPINDGPYVRYEDAAKRLDFAAAALGVVERRRDDLKEENAQLRNKVEDLKKELDVWKRNYEIAKAAFLSLKEEA